MAEVLLETFKQIHSKYLPFVIVDQRIDATTLRRTSPVLFLAIAATSARDDNLLQKRLGAELKKILCERVLVNNERSLELLQALLVYLTWVHYQFNPNTKQTSMLLHMALGLVTDLDLDRCPAHRDQTIGSNTCSMTTQNGMLPTQCQRTTNEIRTLLGCFYLSSTMAMTRKELAMKYTDWVERCCLILKEKQEFPSDISLVILVEAKSLAQHISEKFSYHDQTFMRCQCDTAIQMAMNTFEDRVAELEAKYVSSLQENYALLAELKALRITVYEVALYREPVTAAESNAYTFHLWNLLSSSRDFLEYLFSIPKEVVKDLPAGCFTLFSYALIVLLIVARLPSMAGWDSSIAKQEANLIGRLQHAQKTFGDGLTQTGDAMSLEQRDVWAFFSRGIGALIVLHQKSGHQSENGTDCHVPMSSTIAPCVTRCSVSDLMTAFGALRVRKPNESISFGEHTEAARGTGSLQTQPETVMDLWSDETWQSILDEFSMFSTVTGFPS
ncbi:hypothetical protein PV08_04556 [Exophiala spinifera]|uniref:Transcription factor domain-containing protein n=1 Tax=Exophiala spinifera TaxID=91928 RepID=A0A0D1ZXF6_9EURO|nr:uncharacterized protein PV08_04556 [Exophiala spinifera]KIW17362.1 hypothetical protein PV08_04556 [Exophiala spinifera]